MPQPDAERWNKRYEEEGQSWLGRSPRRLLLEQAHLLPERGLALDAAAGVAVNGRFLAERGLRVIALDIAEVGLRLARQEAQARSLPLEAAVLDLAHLWLPANTFDVILNFRFLERATLPVYHRALKPGGLLFFETFVAAEGNLPHSDYYLQPGELRASYADFVILHSAQQQTPASDAHPARTVEQFVARKPG
jgi:SAM-dependent methyltransferase